MVTFNRKIKMSTQIQIKQELDQIRGKAGGVLHPADVVQYAKNPETALHGQFEWNDSKAAEAHRLLQARQLIRVVVQVSEHTNENVRAFVHIRRQEGNGYRAITEVLSSEHLTQQMLKDARNDLINFQHKYRQLRDLAELSGIFEAIEQSLPASNIQRAGA